MVYVTIAPGILLCLTDMMAEKSSSQTDHCGLPARSALLPPHPHPPLHLPPASPSPRLSEQVFELTAMIDEERICIAYSGEVMKPSAGSILKATADIVVIISSWFLFRCPLSWVTTPS